MGHTKAFLLDDMATKGKEMITLLLAEGVSIKEDHFVFEDECSTIKMTFIRPDWKWMCKVHKKEFAQVQKIKALLSPELWKRYRDWCGFDEHREVVLLREALSILRARMVSRKRPPFLKRSFRAKEIKNKTRDKVKKT